MPTIEAELKNLMVAGLDGDAAAYRTLLDRLSWRLRAYYKSRLARIGRSATEAEDLVQEALLAIHIQRHTYHPAEPLTPWVHAIARYKLIDHLRLDQLQFVRVAMFPMLEQSVQDSFIKCIAHRARR